MSRRTSSRLSTDSPINIGELARRTFHIHAVACVAVKLSRAKSELFKAFFASDVNVSLSRLSSILLTVCHACRATGLARFSAIVKSAQWRVRDRCKFPRIFRRVGIQVGEMDLGSFIWVELR